MWRRIEFDLGTWEKPPFPKRPTIETFTAAEYMQGHKLRFTGKKRFMRTFKGSQLEEKTYMFIFERAITFLFNILPCAGSQVFKCSDFSILCGNGPGSPWNQIWCGCFSCGDLWKKLAEIWVPKHGDLSLFQDSHWDNLRHLQLCLLEPKLQVPQFLITKKWSLKATLKEI